MSYYDQYAQPSLELTPLRKLAYHRTHDYGGPYELFYDGACGVTIISVHASREKAVGAIAAWLEENSWACSMYVGARPENTHCNFFGPDRELERRRMRLGKSRTRSAQRALQCSRRDRAKRL